MAGNTNSRAFVPFFERYYPGVLVVSVLLVLLAVLVTAPVLEPIDQLGIVATGFYELLVVQLAFIFWWVLAATVVYSSRVGRLLDAIADGVASSLTLTPGRVVGTTAAIALGLGWINWALGLIGGVYVGQKLARIAGERDVAVHYPTVLVAGLCGLLLANQGPTSPGGLVMADSLLGTGSLDPTLYPGTEVGGEEATQITQVENYDGFFGFFGIEEPISFLAFLLHPTNLLASAILLITLPLLLARMAQREDPLTIEAAGDLRVTDDIRSVLTNYAPPPREEWTFADRVENSRLLAYLTGGFGLVYVGWYLVSGHPPSLVWLLFSLIMVGLVVHRVPQAYIEQCTVASRWAITIGLPFVFYAAVVVMLHESGVAGAGDVLATAPLVELPSYLLAFAVGLFVPDPGSVWLIVGPILEAGTGDLLGSLVVTMFAAGISNLWLGFVFLGIFATRVDGFDWREFVMYASVITVYASAVVVGTAAVV